MALGTVCPVAIGVPESFPKPDHQFGELVVGQSWGASRCDWLLSSAWHGPRQPPGAPGEWAVGGAGLARH